MVAKLVVCGHEDENRFCSTPQLCGLDGLDGLEAVALCDVIEAQPRQGVVEVVDRRDGRQLPLKLVQNQKLPFLENENVNIKIKKINNLKKKNVKCKHKHVE